MPFLTPLRKENHTSAELYACLRISRWTNRFFQLEQTALQKLLFREVLPSIVRFTA